MRFNEKKGRKAADYNQLDIFDDQPFGSADTKILKGYSTGHRDFPRMAESSGLGSMVSHPMAMGNVLNHPMMNGFWDDLTSKISDVLPSTSEITSTIVESGQQAISSAAGQLATQTLQKPVVQAAITEQATAQAIKATATGQVKFFNWLKTNQKMLMIATGGLVAAYIALKVLKKKK